MKTFLICVLFGICFIMKGGASETINCYVCDNCDILDDSQLRSCPLPDPTDPPITQSPTTLLTDSTTQSTSEESTPGSTGSPLETISTTVSTKPIQTNPPQTEGPITETPKPETTSPKTEQTEEPVETTNGPNTNEGIQTTLSGSSTTETTTNGIPESSAETIRPLTNSAMGSMMQSYNSTNGIPGTFKPPTLTESSEVTPEKTDPVEQSAPSIVINPIMATDFPEVVSAVEIAPEALAPMINLPPETVASIVQSSQYQQPSQIVNRIPRGIRNSRSAPPSYHCYSIGVLDGDVRKVKKGCVEVPEEKDACDVLKDELGKSVDKCKICTVDKCNSCSTLKYSIMTLVMVLVVSFY